MKENERQAAASIGKLFREGKLTFSYFYNPLFTFQEYDRMDDHEFIADYNGLRIRIGKKRVIVDGREPQQTDRHSPPSIDFPLTKELRKIYKGLYHKHEAEIKEQVDAQTQPHQKSQNPETPRGEGDTKTILEKLQ